MLAGKFRHIVEIETKSETQSHSGVGRMWTPLEGKSTRRCSVSPVNAAMQAMYMQKGNHSTVYMIKFRFPLKLKSSKIRFRWKDVYYYPTRAIQSYEGTDLIHVRETENAET